MAGLSGQEAHQEPSDLYSTCRLPAPHVAALLLGMIAVFGAQAAWIKATNFAGFDEWLIVRHASRGIVDSPYSNRPLLFLWSLPSAVVAPHSFRGLVIVHYAYLVACGALVFALCRRLAPREPLLAFLAGTFFLVWTPMDFNRYTPVQMTQSGFTFGMLLSMVLLVEAWVRDRVVLLALGALTALVDVRSYEASLPLLIAAPVLLVVAGARVRDSRFRRWTTAWEAVMGVAALLVAWPGGEQRSYQVSVMGLDPSPAHVLARLAQQYRFHLFPLLFSARSELLAPAVPVAVGVFLLASVLAVRASRAGGRRQESASRLALLAGLGILGAGLGYSLLVLSSRVRTPTRTQFLSGPGIAVLLGSAILLASRPLPARWRAAAATVMAAWVVAVGTGRAMAIQGAWDRIGYYPAQHRVLVGLTEQAPDLAPHTLVVLLDEMGAWPAVFGFRSAVEYLYRGRALGFVFGGDTLLFPTYFTPEGLRTEPWTSIRSPWDCPATLHRYDELVVVRASQSGEVRILDEWPAGVLPPLPPDARYDPWSRVRRDSERPPEQRILEPRT
jgi:hypothetical protein